MTTFARPSTPFPHAQTLSYASASGSYFSPMPSIMPIAESSASSAAASSSRRFARPLHFTLPAMPLRTPPSLLKRSASSSSSSSSTSAEERDSKVARASTSTSTFTASTPPLSERRDSSSSASSSSSSECASPATPPRSMHLALPRQTSSPYFLPASKPAPKATYAAWPEFESLDETPLTAVELLTDDAYDLAVSQAADFYNATSAPLPTPVHIAYYPYQQHAQKQSSVSSRPASPTRPRFKRRDTPRPVETITSLATISLNYEGRRGMVKIQEKEGKRYTSMVDGGEWMVVA